MRPAELTFSTAKVVFEEIDPFARFVKGYRGNISVVTNNFTPLTTVQRPSGRYWPEGTFSLVTDM
jgi:hypothetical protein